MSGRCSVCCGPLEPGVDCCIPGEGRERMAEAQHEDGCMAVLHPHGECTCKPKTPTWQQDLEVAQLPIEMLWQEWNSPTKEQLAKGLSALSRLRKGLKDREREVGAAYNRGMMDARERTLSREALTELGEKAIEIHKQDTDDVDNDLWELVNDHLKQHGEKKC